MELFRLLGTILIEDQEAIQSLKNVDDQGKKTKTKLQDIADKGAIIGAAVISGTGLAIGGLMALADSTAGTADKWDKLSLRTGIAVEELQRWGYAAGQSGADISVLETGMKKLSNTMIDAQNGSESAKSAYEQLGISMTDLATMTPEQTFESVMTALAGMEEGALKNSIGNDLLGKSYTELKPLIAQGADGMQALKDRADELGIVMSEKAVNSGVVFGDTLADAKASLDGVKNGIMADLIPQLTNMLNWFLDHMPEIQSAASNVLNGIADVIGFITDNSNILIPVLGGLLTSFLALKAISTVNLLMDAYKKSTLATTIAQKGLNVALKSNPIGIVITAITALVAIGIALYMNWDTVKEKAGQLFDKMKTVFNNIKDSVSNAVEAVKTKVSNTFEKITDTMSKPFESAKDKISDVINKIKGFLNFNWEFPKLKMPHFSVSGSMNPMKWIEEGVPKISVDWYAKGGIFSKPTIFNTPYGLKGVGDAKSPEVVAPLHKLKEMLGIDNKKDTKLEVNLNIENFYNDSEMDIEKLTDEIAFQAQRKLGGGGVIA
ncbi:MAG: hypothetical protein K0S41_3669 [Anaerocolumna sp.]|jgi:phage-related minor tail protein|nr:hypothetical protein [Anaerocolumna sp.]